MDGCVVGLWEKSVGRKGWGQDGIGKPWSQGPGDVSQREGSSGSPPEVGEGGWLWGDSWEGR